MEDVLVKEKHPKKEKFVSVWLELSRDLFVCWFSQVLLFDIFKLCIKPPMISSCPAGLGSCEVCWEPAYFTHEF